MEAGAVPRVAPPMVPTLTPRLLRLASDARLVGHVRDGRLGAFEVIYDRHHRGIYGFCRHVLGDADEAEDAVQHTFMAAYSDLLRSERAINLKPWLYTIARNRCFSILRARREQPSDEIEESIGEGLATEVQRREDLRDLVHDMQQLPEDQRAALVLAELDSLSHAEIAAVLSVPRERVKALVFQAREALVASRTARDTACSDIREQLAVGRGASLRRGNLRRHLRECDGCRAFKTQVEHQRRRFGALLPVAPTLALKEAIFGAPAVTGGAAAIGGGVIATGALKSGLAKGIVGAIIATVGTAGTVVVATTSSLRLGSLLRAVSGSAGQPRGGRSAAARSSTATAAHRIHRTGGASTGYGNGLAGRSSSVLSPLASGTTTRAGAVRGGGAAATRRRARTAPNVGRHHPATHHVSVTAPAPAPVSVPAAAPTATAAPPASQPVQAPAPPASQSGSSALPPQSQSGHGQGADHASGGSGPPPWAHAARPKSTPGSASTDASSSQQSSGGQDGNSNNGNSSAAPVAPSATSTPANTAPSHPGHGQGSDGGSGQGGQGQGGQGQAQGQAQGQGSDGGSGQGGQGQGSANSVTPGNGRHGHGGAH